MIEFSIKFLRSLTFKRATRRLIHNNYAKLIYPATTAMLSLLSLLFMTTDGSAATSAIAASESTWQLNSSTWMAEKISYLLAMLPRPIQTSLADFPIDVKNYSPCLTAILLGVTMGHINRVNRIRLLNMGDRFSQPVELKNLSYILKYGKKTNNYLFWAFIGFTALAEQIIPGAAPPSLLQIFLLFCLSAFTSAQLGWKLCSASIVLILTAIVLIPTMVIKIMGSNAPISALHEINLHYVFVGSCVLLISLITWNIRRNRDFRSFMANAMLNFWQKQPHLTKPDGNSIDTLDLLAPLIRDNDAAENQIFSYLLANYYQVHGFDKKIIALSETTNHSTPLNDAILVGALLRTGNINRALARLQIYPYPGNGLEDIVKSIPHDCPGRTELLLTFFAHKKDWSRVARIVEEAKNDHNITAILEKFPFSMERDRILLKIYWRNHNGDKILANLQNYNFNKGLQLLKELIPPTRQGLILTIIYFYNSGQNKQLASYLGTIPVDQAVDALNSMEQFPGREQLIVELLYTEANTNELQKYICDSSGLEEILRTIQSSLTRDRHLCNLFYQQENFKAVVEMFEPYQRQDKLNIDDLNLLATSLEKENNIAECLEIAATIRQKDPSSEEYLKYLIKICYKANILHKNLIDNERELYTKPFEDKQLYNTLRELYIFFGRQQLALQCAEKGADRDHDDSCIFLGRYHETRNNPEKAASYYLRSGEKGELPAANCFFALKNYAQAAELFAKRVRDKPDDEKLLYHLGYSCFQLNKPDEAFANFEKLARISGTNAIYDDIIQLTNLLLGILVKKNALHKALAYLQKTRRLLPDDHHAGNTLNKQIFDCIYSIIYQAVLSSGKDGNQLDIPDLFEQAKTIKQTPDRDLDLLWGLWLFKEGQFEKSLQVFAINSKRHPDDHGLQLHKALCALAVNKTDYAEKLLQDLQPAENHDYGHRAKLVLAVMAMGNGSFQDACSLIQQSIQKNEETYPWGEK